MTQRLIRVALAALLSVAAACGGSEPPVDPISVPASVVKTTEPSPSVAVGSNAGVFAVKVTNSAGGPIVGATVTFTVTGSATVSPASVKTDAVGQAQTTVTAGPSAGPVSIVAAVTGTSLSATTSVTVSAISSTSCGGLTVVRTLAVGEVATYQGVSAACLSGTANGSEYAMIAFNGDTAATASTTITATGVGTAPSSAALSPSSATAYRGIVGGAPAALSPDYAFHQRMLEKGRAFASRIPGARRWQSALAATRTTSTRSASGSVPSYSAIGTSPQVGDILSLNVNGTDGCANPDVRGVRIMAIGSKSIVMADTTNPSGGFTTADFQRFAARFDTLVFPMDSAAFGAPTDIDKNGKVGILFTRAVNELTSANSNSYIGGFFFDRDLFPKATTTEFGAGCAGSNEGEMFYMLAPDPTGAVNGNVRTTGLVDSLTTSTIAHEFQHLINASRRIYVNTSASDYEAVWLNEGLSHVAEELLYYRETGKRPRANLTDADIRLGSATDYALWKQDVAQNFQRFSNYLSSPQANSPDIANDVLATRGATWSFLRYAADRLYTTDGDVWYRMANSTTQGFGTLRLVFGTDQVGLLRDWSAANYLDDRGFTVDPRYQHASWNFHDIFTRTFIAGTYPLKVTGLASGASVSVSVVQNSAAFYRLSVPANGEGLVKLSSSGAAPSAFQFVVIRTK